MLIKFALIAIGLLPLYLLALKIVSKKADNPIKRLSWFFYYGILATIPFIVFFKFTDTGVSYLNVKLGVLATVFIFALLEEISKFSIFFFVKKENRRKLYLSCLIAVALGFAYAENIFYFAEGLENSVMSIGAIATLIIRLLLASVAHVAFTSMTGAVLLFGLGKAFFKYLGLASATSLHFVFNWICNQDLTFLLWPFLCIILFAVWKLAEHANSPHYVKAPARHRRTQGGLLTVFSNAPP
ncbi:MAG: PrsW family glutamic-type intramembrane protease [Patescibacteria group bacterium]|nr:PrsW family glutamic-type intramembrane protease [Patescibacteria group bacterium]